MSTCPICGKANVQVRHGATGEYLANVEPYLNGRSYFRGLHTQNECKDYAESVVDRGQAEADRDARLAAREAELDALDALDAAPATSTGGTMTTTTHSTFAVTFEADRCTTETYEVTAEHEDAAELEALARFEADHGDHQSFEEFTTRTIMLAEGDE